MEELKCDFRSLGFDLESLENLKYLTLDPNPSTICGPTCIMACTYACTTCKKGNS